MVKKKNLLFFLMILVLSMIPSFLFAGEVDEAVALGAKLSLWWTLPFAGILLSIAIFPLVLPDFWHHHFGKVSLVWGLVLLIPFLIIYTGEAWGQFLEIILGDYVPFIILLWSLYVVGGGIVVRGSFVGKPIVNTIMLFIGAFFASWVGTTGASMILIRPLLRANRHRDHKVHTVVFFIFLVSNIGGLLTPLGDPPLFMGFLHGVPFFWTTIRLLPVWLLEVGMLLVIYFIIDSYFYKKETEEVRSHKPEKIEKLKIVGLHNFIFLVGIIGGVLFSGLVNLGVYHVGPVGLKVSNTVRDLFLVLMGLLSLKFTAKELYKENEFTWFAIEEVAILFAAIFVTMIPAIDILRAGEEGAMGSLIAAIKSPAHYYWATGTLSSFLDNTPTYLTFFNSALGKFFVGMPEPQAVHLLLTKKAVFLESIATGAVFMGANTYIGNAPNFMVKSIAEEWGIAMPSFFGYILKYSLLILIPTFFVVMFIFFV